MSEFEMVEERPTKDVDMGERCPNEWKCQRSCRCHALRPEELEADLSQHYRVVAERVRDVPIMGRPPMTYPWTMTAKVKAVYDEAYRNVHFEGKPLPGLDVDDHHHDDPDAGDVLPGTPTDHDPTHDGKPEHWHRNNMVVQEYPEGWPS